MASPNHESKREAYYYWDCCSRPFLLRAGDSIEVAFKEHGYESVTRFGTVRISVPNNSNYGYLDRVEDEQIHDSEGHGYEGDEMYYECPHCESPESWIEFGGWVDELSPVAQEEFEETWEFSLDALREEAGFAAVDSIQASATPTEELDPFEQLMRELSTAE